MSLRKTILFAVLLISLILSAAVIGAQDTGTTSNVTYFIVICENSAVVNFSGTMQAGYDLFYRIYSESQGAGNAVTALRQVSVDGTYEFSETINYPAGTTIPRGHVSSAYVAIAREGDSSATIYSDYVDDLQDGCSTPQFQPGGSSTAGGTEPETTGDTTSATECYRTFLDMWKDADVELEEVPAARRRLEILARGS